LSGFVATGFVLGFFFFISPAANVDLCIIQEKEVLTGKGSVNLFAACSKVLCEHHDDPLGPGNLDELIPVECLSINTDHGSLGNQMGDMASIFEEQSNGGATDKVPFVCQWRSSFRKGAQRIRARHPARCAHLNTPRLLLEWIKKKAQDERIHPVCKSSGD
jgi:hypothetical protein